MDNAKIKNDIIAFLKQDCGINEQQLEAKGTVFSSGLLDSLDILKIVLFFENKYGLSISPLEVSLDHFDTVELMADFVQVRLK